MHPRPAGGAEHHNQEGKKEGKKEFVSSLENEFPTETDGKGSKLLLNDAVPRGIHDAAITAQVCILPLGGIDTGDAGDVFLQALVALGVLGVALVDLLQAVAHEELVVACGEDGGGDVDEDGDPRVRTRKGEGFAAEEDGGDDARAQVTREVRRDGVACESPYHGRVGQADGEGHGLRADERVGWVQARPDDDADVAVDEELLEEQVALVRLVWVRERTEDARHAAVVDRRAVLLYVDRLGCLDLRPVARHQHQSRHEGAEDLREYVVRHFLPWEALPDGETDCGGGTNLVSFLVFPLPLGPNEGGGKMLLTRDCRVEVTTRCACTGDDGKSDTKGERPADLEERAKDGHANRLTHGVGGGQGEGCHR